MLIGGMLVFLSDVGNTLLDNDRFTADLTLQLDSDFGRDECERHRSIYAERRDRLGYARAGSRAGGKHANGGSPLETTSRESS